MELQDNQNQIKHAAKEIFLKYGLKSVSVDDISSALHISKKTFYKSFLNKDDLVNQLADDSMRELKVVLDLKSNCNGIERFLWIQYHWFEWLAKYNKSLIHDVGKYYPSILERFEKFKAKVITNELIAILEGAKENKVIHENIDIRFFCQLQVNSLEEVYRGGWVFLRDQEKSNLFEQLVFNPVRGILNSSYGAYFEVENFRADLER